MAEKKKESKREKFLEQITTNGDAFNRFYNSQTDLFKKACAFIVGRFSNQEIQEIFRLLPKNLFTAEKSDYQSTVQSTVDKYISEQSAAKLKELDSRNLSFFKIEEKRIYQWEHDVIDGIEAELRFRLCFLLSILSRSAGSLS